MDKAGLMASRFYMDEDSGRRCSSRQTNLAIRNMGFNPNGDGGVKRSERMRSERKCRRERKLTNASSQTKDEAFPVENGAEALNYQPFSEQDYIVFCFKEDGAFDVVKDGKPEPPNSVDFVSSSPSPVYRKEEEEEEEDEIEEQDDQWSDSSRSNRSRRSFTFPVLRWAWSGSPVKMPKPGLQLRKHKPLLRVGFHCCRF